MVDALHDCGLLTSVERMWASVLDEPSIQVSVLYHKSLHTSDVRPLLLAFPT